MAAKAPSSIEAIEMKTRICCQSWVIFAKGTTSARTSSAIAATFGAAAKKAVTGVGDPSYTSGVHMWNGTAETLKAIPAIRKTKPNSSPSPALSRERAEMAVKLVDPVVP